jgi:FAD synthase
VHLLAPPAGDLCGAPMEVHVLVRLRDDRQFASLDDLRRQIAQDVDRATAILARIPAPSPPIGG